MSSGSPRRFVGTRGREVVAEVLDEEGGEVGLHEPRGDADDPGRAELAGQLAGHVDHRRLGDVVDAEPELRAQAADRGDVHDHARLVLERLVPRHLRPEQRPAQVDLERLVVAGLVDAEREAVVRVGAGVVDEDVEPAEALDRRVDARHRVLGLAGVGGEHLDVAADLGGGRLEPVDLAAAQHHLGARRRRTPWRSPCRCPSTRR